MNIVVLGTGSVGRTLAAKLAELGHETVIGTRDVAELMARTESTAGGRVPPFADWHAANSGVRVDTFAGAVSGSDLIFLATVGSAAVDVLRSAEESNLEGKVVIDVSNALDFSQSPPGLFVSSTESLAERIQNAFPSARVVKTLNTMNASVMVNPQGVGGGDHHVFVSGNDAAAKETVVELLRGGFGWQNILDLGDLSTARGTEMYLPLWLRAMQALGTPTFNIKLVV